MTEPLMMCNLRVTHDHEVHLDSGYVPLGMNIPSYTSFSVVVRGKPVTRKDKYRFILIESYANPKEQSGAI